MARLSLLILFLGLIPSAPEASHRPSGTPPASVSQPESLKRELIQLAHWSKKGPQTDLERLEACAKTLRALDRLWTPDEAQGGRILLGVLDFLGRCILISQAPGGLRTVFDRPSLAGATEADLHEQALEILRKRLPGLSEELTLEILMGREEDLPHPIPRRIAACEVLEADTSPAVGLALLSTTRPVPPETQVARTLMDAAVQALSGRAGAGVDLRLLELLARGEAGLETFWLGGVEAHFESVRLLATDLRTVGAVARYVGPAIQAPDWRRGSRAVAISRALPNEAAIPLLIDGLEFWVERAMDPQKQTRRIQGEILTELRNRSGRTLGAQPAHWRLLWDGFVNGTVRWYGPSAQAGEPLTVGAFFGLRPETDNLVFLLDRSGSMQAQFGSERRHSRLEEAVDQMAGLLTQLGPLTKFNVVTFSGSAQTWHRKPLLATAKNIRAARSWVLHLGTGGGTKLSSGVHKALGLTPGGEVDPEAHGPDTVIVLCDGETSEGPTWVRPLLRRVNDEIRMVFHGVQLGKTGDGTLESLASQSGGKFLRVED